MKILKSDKSRFAAINDFPYKENYVDFEGLQMHYIDEGSGETILALHGEPTWSYLYRKFIPIFSDYRFMAPDLIGFGKSDKIAGWKNYSFELHFKSLENLIKKLELSKITLIVQDWGGILGLSLLGAYPDVFKRVVILNTALPAGEKLPFNVKLWRCFARLHPSLPVGLVLQFGTFSKLNKETLRAYKAPFPGRKFKGGAKSFPSLIPAKTDDEGVNMILKAKKVLSEWTKPALVMFSDSDPIVGSQHSFFHTLIPTLKNQDKIIIENAGHFLQEDKGEEIATRILKFIQAD